MSESTGFKPSVDEPTGGESPLIEFWGVLQSYQGQQLVSKSTNRPYQTVLFKFTDLEVIESTDPYPFPVAELRFFYNPPSQSYGNTAWEALANSVRSRLGLVGSDAFDQLVGKRQHWRKELFPISTKVIERDEAGEEVMVNGVPKVAYVNVDTPSFRIVEVDGIQGQAGSAGGAGFDLVDHVLSLADGKTELQFNAVVMDDQQVMRNPSLVAELTNGSFMATMTATGKLTKDAEGLLHKV